MAQNNENQFKKFGLSNQLVETLSMLGYKEPTPIQCMALPAILKGEDVVGKSQTGSGKTAAFAIPICEKIVWEENAPQALILEPTRELAVQVQEEVFQIGRKKRLKVPVVFGGMPIDKQAISLKQKSHIVVGTPGRILDHIRRGNLQLDQVQYVVIDEADLMLDMGFIDDVETILKECVKPHHTYLFSATVDAHLEHLVERYMNHPKQIVVESEFETADGLEQIGYEVDIDHKFQAFMDVLVAENPAKAMIFCGTREMVNTLCHKMKRKKIRCGMLHGGLEQRERLYAIGDFRKGKFPYLITTDVAARGIDFDGITHVFNYDFTTNKKNYVHRIGRTARNGKTGKAISFISKEEMYEKKRVEQYIGLSLQMKQVPGRDEVEQQQQAFAKKQKEKVVIHLGKGEVFRDTIMKLTIGGGKKSKIRPTDIVGTLCSIEGIEKDDIGIIDIRESLCYVEILNGKGEKVLNTLQHKTIKGKIRKVKKTRL